MDSHAETSHDEEMMQRIGRALVLSVIGFIFPLLASAATLSAVPGASSVTVGDIVTVRIVVNADGTAINQSNATLRFPSSILEVISVSKSSSIFTLWVEEPAYSNGGGTVTFDGGLPTPGYSGSYGTVLSVTFRAKQTGTASISFGDAAVRANDGFGTDVLTYSGGTQIQVVGAVSPQAPVAPAPAPTPSQPSTGLLTDLASPTHPSSDTWYSDVNPRLSWNVARSVTSVQMIVSEDSDTAPSVTYTPPINEKKIDALTDGVWYFSVRAKAGDTWTPKQTYTLKIDSTPPTLAAPQFAYDAVTQTLTISRIAAEDATSGILRYEYRIGDEETVALLPEDVNEGSYAVAYSAGSASGRQTIEFAVVDQAGNRVSAIGSFTLPQSLLHQTLFTIFGFAVTVFWSLLFFLLLVLISLGAAASALWFLFAARKKKSKRNGKRDQILHRALGLFKNDLARHLDSLDKAHKVRDLTLEERTIRKDLGGNIDDLERYLKKEFKKFD